MSMPLMPLLPAIGSAVVALAGCSMAEVRLSDGFSSRSISYEVSGYSPRRFNQPLRFGPYSALEMRDGGIFSTSIPLRSVELQGSWRPFAFTQTTTGQPPVEVRCQSTALSAETGRDSRRLSIDLNALAGPFMDCGLRPGNNSAGSFELSRNGVRIQGMLESESGPYAVRSIHLMAGTSLPTSEPAGVEFQRDGKVLALVDLLNSGRVHMDRSLDEHERIYLAAAASSVLMLDLSFDG
ncbi:hypothetical protein [Dokdonella sp.]|uniref:hypothetical protein n=1 Tax=Dokdonella sp. TaxID=2291710 RepID=UPI003C4DF9A4